MRSMACPSPALAVPDLRLRAPDGLADAVDAGPALAPGPADVRAAGPGSAQGADTRPGPAVVFRTWLPAGTKPLPGEPGPLIPACGSLDARDTGVVPELPGL